MAKIRRFTTLKLCPKGLKKLPKCIENVARNFVWIFCLSGEISLNLVTLLAVHTQVGTFNLTPKIFIFVQNFCPWQRVGCTSNGKWMTNIIRDLSKSDQIQSILKWGGIKPPISTPRPSPFTLTQLVVVDSCQQIFPPIKIKLCKMLFKRANEGSCFPMAKEWPFPRIRTVLFFIRACLCETSMDKSWTEENRVGKAFSNRKKHSQQKTTELTALSLCDNECPQLDTQSVGEQRLFSSSYWQFD